MSERAVSNTLGFVLIFTLVLMSLTLVSTAGLGGLEDTRDASMLKNAEQSMESLATAVEDVHREGEERRTASIRLGRGQLLPGEETTITVEVQKTGTTTTYQTTTRPIVYRLDDTQIIYEGSALIREQQEGAVMLRKPSFRLESNGVIIPMVNTTATRQGAIRGSNAQIALRRVNSTTKTYESGTTNPTVTIKVDTPSDRRDEVWKQSINEQIDGSDPCSITVGSLVECSLGFDETLIVRKVTVAYTFSG